MLPDFLVPSYKQYKTDSDTVATWLANTAQRCGYSRDLLTNQVSSQQKAPKLKGRARKLAREATQNESLTSLSENLKSKTTPQALKYLIATKDFISLAEWIAKSTTPRVEVPASFVSVLDRAITVRKRHHSWWYSQTEGAGAIDDEDVQANESHGYFIGVLEKVREVLRPKMPPELHKDPLARATDEVPAAKNSGANGQIVNLFENLDIEEPSDALLYAGSSPSSQRPVSTTQTQFGVEQVPDIEEVYFAVHCLFNDLDNIRRYLQQVWKGYEQGVFDLVAASITTNTAMDFARRLQEDFIETFPQHTDFEQHLKVLFVQLCLAADQSPAFRERPDDEMNFAVYEDAEPIFFPTYLLLLSFSDVIQPGQLPIYKPGHYGVYDPRSDRSLKSSREKFREDRVILLGILPDFCVFAFRHGSIPSEDEMTRGIGEMAKEKRVSIWLSFAAQVYLDIHHILREKVGRGFDDLTSSAKYVQSNIRQVMKFHENLRIENWPNSNDQCLFQILDRIKDWVMTDAVAAARNKMVKGSPFDSLPTEPFMLLKYHPMYCGLLSYSITALAQEASIVFANAWGSVLYTAHLYNALRQERLLMNAWQDMDLALAMHRTDDMFIGDFPKTIDDYFKRFSLAMGYSASVFAKNRRQKGIVASKAGPRGLNDLSPISALFKERYCGNERLANLSLEDVDSILKRYADEDNDSDMEESSDWISPRIRTTTSAETPLVSPSKKTRRLKPPHRLRKPRRSAMTGVRPIQLLDALLNAIQSEMPELTFDHFRLHTFSWRLLRTLKDALDEDLHDIYGSRYIEKEGQLPFIVGYIFMTTVQTTKLEGLLAPKKKDVVTDRLLVKAARVLNDMLEAGGAERHTEDRGWRDWGQNPE
jgi:hypothetical protein